MGCDCFPVCCRDVFVDDWRLLLRLDDWDVGKGEMVRIPDLVFEDWELSILVLVTTPHVAHSMITVYGRYEGDLDDVVHEQVFKDGVVLAVRHNIQTKEETMRKTDGSND